MSEIPYLAKRLKDLTFAEQEKRKRRGELETPWHEYNVLSREIEKSEKERWKTEERLRILDSVPATKELKRIIGKIMKASDNGERLFDFFDSDFCSYDENGRTLHLSLFFYSFRKRDLKPLLKKIEKITKYQITDWYLGAYISHQRAMGACISLSINLREKEKEKKEVAGKSK